MVRDFVQVRVVPHVPDGLAQYCRKLQGIYRRVEIPFDDARFPMAVRTQLADKRTELPDGQRGVPVVYLKEGATFDDVSFPHADADGTAAASGLTLSFDHDDQCARLRLSSLFPPLWDPACCWAGVGSSAQFTSRTMTGSSPFAG